MVGRETCPNKSPFSVSNFQFVHFSSTFPASLQYFSSFHKLNLESPPAACFLFFNFHKIYSNNTKFIVVSFYFSARKTFSFHLLVTDDAACLDGLGEKGGGMKTLGKLGENFSSLSSSGGATFSKCCHEKELFSLGVRACSGKLIFGRNFSRGC